MVNKEVLYLRLQKLDEYLKILYGFQKYSLDEFLNDPQKYGATERFLLLAIESINDIGNHIIADEKLGNVD